ncbi:MAG: hypothetical protein NC489_20940 [Ruminococcus flavefaciens]|nr:hypothetical protein [Ruminococcus flavefaciens]
MSHDVNKKSNKPQKVDPDPVAILLKDEMVRQITMFLDTPEKDRAAVADKSLFKVEPYPAHLDGCEGAEKYEAYLLERSSRMRRDDPTKHGRLSCSIVCLDRETHAPRFFVQAVIMPSDVAMVTVLEQDDKGTDYRKTVKWNNRDE